MTTKGIRRIDSVKSELLDKSRESVLAIGIATFLFATHDKNTI